MRNTNRCQDPLSETHLEHLLLETNTMRKINEFSIPAISQNSFHLDRSVFLDLFYEIVGNKKLSGVFEIFKISSYQVIL